MFQDDVRQQQVQGVLIDDTSEANMASDPGPVCITDWGRPAHVLLAFDTYEELVGPHRALDLLA